MRKALFAVIAVLSLFFLAACIQPITEVVAIELQGWVPQEMYEVNTDVDLSDARVEVEYADGASETLRLTAEGVSLTGNLNVSDMTLDTDTSGQKQIVVSFSGLSLTANFLVYDVKVNTLQGIKDAIADDTVIIVEEGTYSQNNDSHMFEIKGIKNLYIKSEVPHGAVLDLNSGKVPNRVFFITTSDDSATGTISENITIEGFRIEKSLSEIQGYDAALNARYFANNITFRNNHLVLDNVAYGFNIQGGAINVLIENNIIEGTYETGIGLLDVVNNDDNKVAGVGDAEVYDNVILNYSRFGIQLMGVYEGINIYDNTFDSDLASGHSNGGHVGDLMSDGSESTDWYSAILDLDAIITDNIFEQDVVALPDGDRTDWNYAKIVTDES